MADWFSKLSPAAKKAYIAKHPTSKYASAKSRSNEKDRKKAIKAGKKLLGKTIDLTPKSKKVAAQRKTVETMAKLKKKIPSLKRSQ